MNIVAVSVGSYPGQSASSLRHMAVLRGLSLSGCNIKLYSLIADARVTLNGINLTDIEIEIMTHVKNWAHGLVKYLLFITGIIKVVKRLIKLKSANRLDILILYTTDPYSLYLLLLLGNILSVKVVHERTEFPFLKSDRSIKGFLFRHLYLDFIIPKFDAIVVISTALRDYFKPYFKKEIFILSIVTECKRFDGKALAPLQYKYLAYCGSMDFTKDGLDDLIESYASIYESIADYKLVLIGDVENSPDKKAIHNMVASNNLCGQVIFTGTISSLELPCYLNNASALLLNRPNNLQARYGMPSKLGEYLCTGKPVIVTSVSDIPNYLDDSISAFLVKPGSNIDFSQKILDVLDNYENALQIGAKGREVCISKFDYQVQGEKFADFLKSLL